MKTNKFLALVAVPALLFGVSSCKDDDVTLPADYEQTPEGGTVKDGVAGMYLLNEGNMGSNKCTLDFLDFSTGYYARNIYPERNPEEVLELGDTGSDELVYDGRLFISVGGSNKVEVLDAASAVKTGKVDISNAGKLAAGDGYVYVGSYTGGYQIDPDVNAGTIYKIDPKTLSVAGTLVTPYWPEGMAVSGGKLFVATSGSVSSTEYPANSVLVVNPADMTVEKTIEVGPNLNMLKADDAGNIWVSSRGDYMSQPSRLYCIKIMTDEVKEIPVACTEFALYGGKLYLYSTVWSYVTSSNEINYNVVDMASCAVMPGSFLAEGSEKEISTPYGIAINPANGDIYISDAKNYTSSGSLVCFNNAGIKKWSVKTGDIPGHMIFFKR